MNNFFAALKAIDEALDKVWGGFNTGPYISFVYPTTIKLNLIKVDGSAYSDLDLIGNRITGKGGPAPGSSVKTLRIQTAPQGRLRDGGGLVAVILGLQGLFL